MKQFTLSLITTMTLCLALIGCQNQAEFTLSSSALQMKVGDLQIIEAIGASSTVTWTSSDTAVATVFAGAIEAKAIGKALVTATAGTITRSCEVFVTSTSGSGLRLSPYTVDVAPGEQFQMKIGNAFGLDLEWEVAHPEIATVSADGLVTALQPGLTKVILRSPVEQVESYIAVRHNWGDYQLVWSDEFDDDHLDTEVWDYNIGGGGWGNRELQYYTDRTENVRVEDGCLVIEALKEDYQNNHYTSGRILSRGKKEFLYGKFEARIKFPGGKGTWPAWWMMGGRMNWPACGEIDIMEHVGNIDNRASFALHTPLKNGSNGRNWSKVQFFDYPLSDDFHVYGVEWAQQEKGGSDVIRFYVDGVQYAEVWQEQFENNDSWPFQKAHFLILNLAIGGTMGGTVDDNIFLLPCRMFVDWVRVYQRTDK